MSAWEFSLPPWAQGVQNPQAKGFGKRSADGLVTGKHPSVEKDAFEENNGESVVKRGAFTLLFFFLALPPAQLLGQSKMKVAYSSITGNQAPLWITQFREISKRTVWKWSLSLLKGEAGSSRRWSPAILL